jgi:hypothetical protein
VFCAWTPGPVASASRANNAENEFRIFMSDNPFNSMGQLEEWPVSFGLYGTTTPLDAAGMFQH